MTSQPYKDKQQRHFKSERQPGSIRGPVLELREVGSTGSMLPKLTSFIPVTHQVRAHFEGAQCMALYLFKPFYLPKHGY